MPAELVCCPLGVPASLPQFARPAAHLLASVRGPSGPFDRRRWQVLADRTQVPSGAGYALENRIVISRMLPHVFHDCQVQRLATFFMTLRDTLRSLALHHRENPRIVLLSPGPRSPTYFEDAYLARYLGYTLVAGDDLAVRDYRVYLKTLGGLLPVDVILRRVYDEDCDPLELRSDSLLGVPGLVQAARSGNVVMANSLGSGLLEAPVWSAFLPRLCRYFLAEDLQLPSVQTWWCGRPERSAVRAGPFAGAGDQAGFRPAGRTTDFRRPAVRPSERATWPSASAPHRATSWPRSGSPAVATPVWSGERLQPCQLGPADVLGRRRGWLHRHARRIVPRLGRRRLAGRFDGARAKGAKTSGCCRRGRWPRSACCIRPARRWRCGAAATNCPAAWPTICSGSAGTPNGAKASCGCCAACWPG